MLSFTSMAARARNKDIISDQARCSTRGKGRNYLRSIRFNTNNNIDMLSFTSMAARARNKYITSNQARRNNCGKSRNYLRSTQFNTNIKSMCCRLHRWQQERGIKVLHQTRQGAVIVEKVGTTYALLESIQTKISICCRLHRWQQERGTNISHQIRQDAVSVETVGTRPTRINRNNNIDMLSFTWMAL